MSTDTHEHLLISRVIDGDANEQEWTDLESLALRNPQVWRELAEAQRDHAALMRGVSTALALADTTPLPSSREVFACSDSSYRFQQRLHRLSAWAGWAVAAMVVLAFVTHSPQSPIHTSSIVPQLVNTPDEALNNYLNVGTKAGRVIEQVPTRVMMQSNPLPSGHGFEVIYLRQIIEKTTVPDLYQFAGEDERGQPTPVRMHFGARGSM